MTSLERNLNALIRGEKRSAAKKKRPEKEVFETYYLTHTLLETAAHFNTNEFRICKWRRHYGTSSLQEIQQQRLNSMSLSQKQIEIICGSLLGDGTITKTTRDTHNSYFVENHCKAQAGYLDFKAAELGEFKSRICDSKKSRSGLDKHTADRTVRVLRSVSHPQLTELEKKWYKRDGNGNHVLKNGKRIKVIPADLESTPLMVAIWYLDDGYHQPLRRHAGLCTDCFTMQEVEFLAEKLRALGIANSHAKMNKDVFPRIYIGSSSYLDFINMVAPFVTVDCMKYKIDLSEYVEPSVERTPPEVVDEIINLWDAGRSYPEIEEITGVRKLIVGDLLRSRNKVEGRANNTSGVEGVSWREDRGKWRASITVQKQPISLGMWDTREEAIAAREEAVHLRDNGVVDILKYHAIRNTSPHANKGFFFNKRRGRWLGYVNYSGRTIYLGPVSSEEEAKDIRVSAEKLIASSCTVEELVAFAKSTKKKILRRTNTTGTEGVYWHSKRKAYLVTISMNDGFGGRMNVALGGYDQLEDAVKVRAEAERLKSLGIRDRKVYLALKPKQRKNNTSGISGVCQKGSKWIAQIHVNNQHKPLGVFLLKKKLCWQDKKQRRCTGGTNGQGKF